MIERRTLFFTAGLALLPVLPAIAGSGISAGSPYAMAEADGVSAPSAVPVVSADTWTEEIDSLFGRWHRPDSPGAAVLVMEDGRVVHRAGYGMASLEHGVPVRPETVFDIASISKQFGAWAIAVLEAEGRLSLDDDVRRYIPELPDFGHTITLRHLVHHTSGLRDWPGTLSMAGWAWEDVLSFDQILRMAFRQRDLNFAPGEEFAYSNTGYNLMAEVVARVSGSSFREFMEQRLFGPLGMDRTHFHDDHREVVAHRAGSYAPGPDGRWRQVTNNLTALGSSSLFTTVDDLARWIEYLHEPDSHPGVPDVTERMHERGVLNGGDTIAYAFGQNWDRWRGLRVASHGGSWAGFRTALHRYPDERLAIVVLANTADMNPTALAREIAGLRLGDRMDPVTAAGTGGEAAPSEVELWAPGPEELAEYEGEYRAAEFPSEYRLTVVEGRLVARHFRTGDRILQPQEPDRFQAPGFGRVEFVRGPDGGITGFTANSVRIRGLRFEKVPGR